MSKIEPVQRDPFLNAELYARLNEPAPASNDKNDVTRVDPVKPANRTELLGDRRELNPGVDPESDRLVMRVVDRDTKEVVFQTPPEVALQLAREQRQLEKRRRSPLA